MSPEFVLDSILNNMSDFANVLTINGSQVHRVTADSDNSVHVYTVDGKCFTFKGAVNSRY